jgi:ABC-type nickel/cobalt efflux system permease component RcnA
VCPGRRLVLSWLALTVGLACTDLAIPAAWPHDIPNQRVDRSIQIVVKPGRLELDYEVSLTELTLTQDLRTLIGSLPGADRAEWLSRYGQVTGPLNAKGFLVSVDGVAMELSARGYDLVDEEHPRYTFHLQATIPTQGRLSIRDTNFTSSEGTSRLAIRGQAGVLIEDPDWPADVEQVPIRPVWQLSDEEERRTKRVDVRFHTVKKKERRAGWDERQEAASASGASSPAPWRIATARPWANVSQLLDRSTGLSWVVLTLIAVGLGAAHAIQPGHGKTLVTAVALGPGARSYQPALLGLATALAHTGSVLLVALMLWYTGTSRVGTIHRGLAQVGGFAIAAAGFWRLGRYLGGYGEHEDEALLTVARDNLGLLGLGLAGGLVPCWEAVGLLVLAAALDRLSTGVGLVVAFSIGMATVLVAVGCLAWKLKSAAIPLDRSPIWRRRLGLMCGIILAAMGLWLFFQ